MTNALTEKASKAVEDLIKVRSLEKTIDADIYNLPEEKRFDCLTGIKHLRETIEQVLADSIPEPVK